MDELYGHRSNYYENNGWGAKNESNQKQFATDWDQYLGDGSRVFFLDENGKVINDDSAGYWELYKSGGFIGIGETYTWVYHAHAYSQGVKHNGCSNPVSSKQYTDYTATDRPDREYWTTAAN